MKKALIVFAAVLIGTFVLLSVLGQKGDYVVEKKVWKLYQKHLDPGMPGRWCLAAEEAVGGYERFEFIPDVYARADP